MAAAGVILYLRPLLLRIGSTVTRGPSSSSLSSPFRFLLWLLLLLPTTFGVFFLGFSCCCWSAAACMLGTVDGVGIDETEKDTAAAADAALVLIVCCWPFRVVVVAIGGSLNQHSFSPFHSLFLSLPSSFQYWLKDVGRSIVRCRSNLLGFGLQMLLFMKVVTLNFIFYYERRSFLFQDLVSPLFVQGVR